MKTLQSELQKLRNLTMHIAVKTRDKIDSKEIIRAVNNYIYRVELMYQREMKDAVEQERNSQSDREETCNDTRK